MGRYGKMTNGYESDKSETCPVCSNEIKNHTVQNFIDCIEKLMNKKPSYFNVTSPTEAKNQEALKVINGLLELSRKDLEEYEKKDPEDLTIKVILQYQQYYLSYVHKQKELLEKLRDILV
jgi:nucleoside-diphosphate-sugar epimerase